jgi:OmpA-OmpF porin, OOP family
MNINKYILLVAFSFFAISNCFSQRRAESKLFLDLGAGSTNAVEPYSPGYRSSTFGFIHANLGVRYMMNARFGYRVQAGYDQIKSAPAGLSLPFKSTYYRGSAEAIIDLGEVLRFNEFTTLFGLLLHGGVGYSSLSGSGKTAGMGHFINGLTMQAHFGSSFDLFLDLTRVNSVHQQITFDMQNPYNEKGFDGMIFNMSLGCSIKLSKTARRGR